MAETQPNTEGAWYCGNRPQFDADGNRNLCPPEGCSEGQCALDECAPAFLRPCPVCGCQPKRRGSPMHYRAGIFRLQCMGETHLFQSYGATEAIAIAAWNQRHP